MPQPPKVIDYVKLCAACMAATATARAEGRHSSDASDWCQECGEKVANIYHVAVKKRICILCAARAGVRGAEEDLRKFEPELHARLVAERETKTARA